METILTQKQIMDTRNKKAIGQKIFTRLTTGIQIMAWQTAITASGPAKRIMDVTLAGIGLVLLSPLLLLTALINT